MIEAWRIPLAVTAGAAVGVGAAMLLLGMHRRPPAAATPGRRSFTVSPGRMRRLAVGVVVGLVILVLTRWIVLAVVAAVVIAFWDRILGGAAEERRAIARAEGLAAWIESLRDTIAGAVGLEQAIPATAANAAASVRPALNLLVDRLRVREPMPDALADFADDLDDPSADLVVAALILNARLRGPGLRDVLTALAESARDELDVRRRVEGSRRSTRRSVQIVIGVIVVVAGLLVLLNRSYVAPYQSAMGQLVLAVVIGLFGLGVLWLRRLSGVEEAERFLVAARSPQPTRPERSAG
ncbi:type II secretion system F family protein [Nocardioides maradonensis]